MASTWITFMSDYGVDGACVGVCHGIIARHAPEARVLDLCHSIEPQDVGLAAVTLVGAIGYLPSGIHLVVVEQLDASGYTRGIVVRSADGSLFVVPDNGVASLGWELLGGAEEAYQISNPDLWLPLPTAVFRGRDVYAPVAARLATGLSPADVGPRLDVAELVSVEPRTCHVDDDHVHGEVVSVDHFGNLSLNMTRAELEAAGILLGDRVEVRADARLTTMPFAHTYGEVAAGELALCEDALRQVMIAVNCGRAAEVLRLRRGDSVVVAQMPRTGPRTATAVAAARGLR
ncbi:SAM-dependent chlorinase/fluorinase [Frankia sp. Cpl3]|nr:SAM-dependent chlorinase/fluorinase [Frankia sp. Cpl3]